MKNWISPYIILLLLTLDYVPTSIAAYLRKAGCLRHYNSNFYSVTSPAFLLSLQTKGCVSCGALCYGDGPARSIVQCALNMREKSQAAQTIESDSRGYGLSRFLS